MNRLQKIIILSLISTSGIAWLLSAGQQDTMMEAMTTYNPLSISLFTASWTAGMAAMMFPAITPMVLLYNTFVTNKENKGTSVTIQEESRPKSSSIRSFRVILFIGCYLLVWALTGVGLLLGWSIVMNTTIMSAGNSQLLPYIYGALLIVAGVYQFTPLKTTCIGFCESPMSFFLRRWRDGTFGAMRMGLWHGMYCLGCCWAYFLLMVALGWMNLLWMGLFAGIIFGEKMWSKGIWVARAAGIGLAIVGILVIAGMLPSLVSSVSSMNDRNGSMDKVNGGDISIPNDNNEKSSTGIQDTDKSTGQDAEDVSSMEPGANQKTPAMNMQ